MPDVSLTTTESRRNQKRPGRNIVDYRRAFLASLFKDENVFITGLPHFLHGDRLEVVLPIEHIVKIGAGLDVFEALAGINLRRSKAQHFTAATAVEITYDRANLSAQGHEGQVARGKVRCFGTD